MSRARICRPHITAAGLAARTADLLQRERLLYAAAAADVARAAAADAVDGETVDEAPGAAETVVTMDQLEAVFRARSATAMPSAAFVAGRCQPDQDGDRAALNAMLGRYLASLDPRRLDSAAPAYVQAAMSLALRGDIEAGRRALRAMAAGDTAGSMADALALAYLAQLGDASGLPRIVALLGSGDAYTRLMAARQLPVFAALGPDVDLPAALMALADDDDELVAREVPALLAQLKPPALRGRLARLADHARHASTRAAAHQLLQTLPAAAAGS